MCRAWAFPHQQSDVRKLSSLVSQKKLTTLLLLHWIVLIDFVHLDTVEINTQNFHGLIDRTLQICICIALKDDVLVDSQLQLVFSGVTKILFHSISFSLYFPVQKTFSVLLLMDKNIYILRQQFIHTAIKEFHLCFELSKITLNSVIFSFCFLKTLFSYCYGLTVAWPALERPKTFTGKCYMSLKRWRDVRVFKLQSMYLANGPSVLTAGEVRESEKWKDIVQVGMWELFEESLAWLQRSGTKYHVWHSSSAYEEDPTALGSLSSWQMGTCTGIQVDVGRYLFWDALVGICSECLCPWLNESTIPDPTWYTAAEKLQAQPWTLSLPPITASRIIRFPERSKGILIQKNQA